jgi:hypothetical protein
MWISVLGFVVCDSVRESFIRTTMILSFAVSPLQSSSFIKYLANLWVRMI